MKKAVLIFALLSLAACSKKPEIASYSFNCENLNADILGAVYEVSHEQKAANAEHEHGQQNHKQFTLWREGAKAAHQYNAPAITTAWALDKNASLYSWQYFDTEQRAIEHEPTHLSDASRDRIWQQKRQIVSAEFIQKMTKIGSAGSSCNATEQYTLNKNDTQVTLTWLPELQLPASFEIDNAQGHTHWQLKTLTANADEVAQAFTTRENYFSTDFADIGDNESDPFLLKMMNLGFIEHGSSGFYNSDGQALEGGHAH